MKKEKKGMKDWSAKEVENFNKLTNQEKLYYKMMRPKSGVLYLQAKPGIAKSAMGKNIADNMEYHYEDMRLSMCDETDFKFPYKSDTVDEKGNKVVVSQYAIPKWAYDANTRPTIIHFEELNRAPQFVRNAALQILLERQIGDFKFNDNVLMMASGNLGEEDGTDVEEFDNALKNRLLTYNHSLAVKDWINNYAKSNINPTILEFIENNPEYLYKDPTENVPSYATPRSWTFLSDFIVETYGFDATPNEFLNDVQEVGMSYVGQSITRFIKFCQEKVQLSIEDIIRDFKASEKILKKFGRDKSSELLTSLKNKDLSILNDKELKNVLMFLNVLDKDELMGYLIFLVDASRELCTNELRILKHFQSMLDKIKTYTNEEPTDTQASEKN
jgi:hypothetical protein